MVVALSLALYAIHQSSSPLDGDPALDKPLSIETPGESISRFLAEISEKTGLKIDATPYVGQDVLILRADKLPIKEILGEIATHFGWTWERDRNGLHLTATSRQKKLEEDARNAQILEPYLAWQKGAVESLKVSSNPADAKDYEKLRARKQELLGTYDAQYGKGSPSERKKWSDENAKVSNEMQAISRRLGVAWRLVDQALASLTPAQMLALDRDTKLVLSYRPTVWQNPLPDSTKATVEEYVREAAAFSKGSMETDPDFLSRGREMNMEPSSTFEPDGVGTVRIVWKSNGPRIVAIGWKHLPAILTIISKSGSVLSQSRVTDKGIPEMPERKADLVRPKDQFDDPLPKTDRLKGLLEGADDRLILNCIQKASDDFSKPHSKTNPIAGRGVLLLAIADAAGINLISDGYSIPRVLRQKDVSVATPRTALDRWARASYQSWKPTGSWIALRANNWQLARSSGIPEDLLFKVRDSIFADKSASFEAVANVCTLLTDRQLGSDFFGTAFPNIELLRGQNGGSNVYALRLWDSFTPQLRQQLQKGVSISAGTLGPAQRDLLLAYLFRSDGREEGLPRSGISYGLEDADLAWLAAAWPPPATSAAIDDEMSQILPTGIPESMQISFHQSTGNGLAVIGPRGSTMSMTEADAIVRGDFRPDRAERDYIPIQEHRLYFGVFADPGFALGVKLSYFDPPPKNAVTADKLPDNVRNRLNKAYEARQKGG